MSASFRFWRASARIGSVFLSLAFLLNIACAASQTSTTYQSNQSRYARLLTVEVGMPMERVLSLVGRPDEYSKDSRQGAIKEGFLYSEGRRVVVIIAINGVVTEVHDDPKPW